MTPGGAGLIGAAGKLGKNRKGRSLGDGLLLACRETLIKSRVLPRG